MDDNHRIAGGMTAHESQRATDIYTTFMRTFVEVLPEQFAHDPGSVLMEITSAHAAALAAVLVKHG